MPAEKSIPGTRTVRLPIVPSPNARKVGALADTTTEWERAVAFYTDLFLDHPGVFEATKRRVVPAGPRAGETEEVAWTDKDRLTWAESVTVATPAHPNIAPDRDFDTDQRGAQSRAAS